MGCTKLGRINSRDLLNGFWPELSWPNGGAADAFGAPIFIKIALYGAEHYKIIYCSRNIVFLRKWQCIIWSRTPTVRLGSTNPTSNESSAKNPTMNHAPVHKGRKSVSVGSVWLELLAKQRLLLLLLLLGRGLINATSGQIGVFLLKYCPRYYESPNGNTWDN